MNSKQFTAYCLPFIIHRLPFTVYCLHTMDYSFFILIISIFAARFIQLNAFRTLAEEDKGKVLSKETMRLSQISTIVTIVFVGAFFLLIGKFPQSATVITLTFFTALLLQRIIVYYFTRKQMLKNNVPSAYISKYFLSWLITTVGVALFIYLYMQQSGNGAK